MLDTTQLWELTKIILQGLQYVDYRFLNNIDRRAYEYLVNSTLVAFARDLVADPRKPLKNALSGETNVNELKRNFMKFENVRN